MKTLTRTFVSILTLALIALFGYSLAIEPATVSAQDTDQFYVNLTVDSGISISDCNDTTLLPNLGLTNNIASGASTCFVQTTDVDGFSMFLAETEDDADPALENLGTGTDIADYTEATPGTPEAWSSDTNTVQFGFSVYGDEVDNAVYGGTEPSIICENETGNIDGNYILTVQGDGDLFYRGFQGDTNILIASSDGPTDPDDTSGARICFAVEQNGVLADSGTYQADITATAAVN